MASGVLVSLIATGNIDGVVQRPHIGACLNTRNRTPFDQPHVNYAFTKKYDEFFFIKFNIGKVCDYCETMILEFPLKYKKWSYDYTHLASCIESLHLILNGSPRKLDYQFVDTNLIRINPRINTSHPWLTYEIAIKMKNSHKLCQNWYLELKNQLGEYFPNDILQSLAVYTMGIREVKLYVNEIYFDINERDRLLRSTDDMGRPTSEEKDKFIIQPLFNAPRQFMDADNLVYFPVSSDHIDGSVTSDGKNEYLFNLRHSYTLGFPVVIPRKLFSKYSYFTLDLKINGDIFFKIDSLWLIHHHQQQENFKLNPKYVYFPMPYVPINTYASIHIVIQMNEQMTLDEYQNFFFIECDKNATDRGQFIRQDNTTFPIVQPQFVSSFYYGRDHQYQLKSQTLEYNDYILNVNMMTTQLMIIFCEDQHPCQNMVDFVVKKIHQKDTQILLSDQDQEITREISTTTITKKKIPFMMRPHPFKKMELLLQKCPHSSGDGTTFQKIIPLMYQIIPSSEHKVYHMIFHKTPQCLPYNKTNLSIGDFLTNQFSGTVNFSRISDVVLRVYWDADLGDYYNSSTLNFKIYKDSINQITADSGIMVVRYST